MTPEERAALDPQSEEYRLRVGGSKNQLAGWLTYTTLLWTLKACMLIFYSRLTYVEHPFFQVMLLYQLTHVQRWRKQYAHPHPHRRCATRRDLRCNYPYNTAGLPANTT